MSLLAASWKVAASRRRILSGAVTRPLTLRRVDRFHVGVHDGLRVEVVDETLIWLLSSRRRLLGGSALFRHVVVSVLSPGERAVAACSQFLAAPFPPRS